MAAPPRRPLPRRFFARATEDVARELVGCTLWVRRGDLACAGRIVETEAYLDERDPASHAGRGLTPRSAIMFGPPAVAYVYLIYGMHHCLNVVTEADGRAGAVLLRALEPLAGVPAKRERRPRSTERLLCAGPGRLCRALDIDLEWNGLPLAAAPKISTNNDAPGGVWIAAGRAPRRVTAGPRVGIRQAADRPLRFCDPDSPSLSVPAPGGGFDRSRKQA
jgi:DNA-3-methyladenine glycosylase